jgi:hypothetical protein
VVCPGVGGEREGWWEGWGWEGWVEDLGCVKGFVFSFADEVLVSVAL